MIKNDIFEQEDLFDIAGCRRKSRLIDWLISNGIPFVRNARDQIIAHRKAIELGLGVVENTTTPQTGFSLGFEED